MAVATPIPFVKAQFFDRCGNVLAGGKVFTYEPRSTTPKVTYNAPISGTPNTNPVILDAAGQADIYLYGRYRIIVQDANGVVVNDSEDIGSWYSGDLDSQLDSVNQYLTDSGNALVQSQQERIDQMVNTGLVGAGSTDTLVAMTNGSGRSQKDKNNEILTLADFKNSGNTWAQALTAALSTSNCEIDGNFKTVALTSLVTSSAENIKLKNLTIDVSGLSSTGANQILKFAGSQGADVALTVNTVKGTNVITVADTSAFTASGWVWLQSNADFAIPTDGSGATKISQVARIKSKSATTLTLYDDVLYDFLVADAAIVAPLNVKSKIMLENITLIGSGANNQSAIVFDRCFDVRAENIRTDHVDYAGIVLERCINVVIDKPRCYDAQATTTSYGVVVSNGCYNVIINEPYGQDLRHVVTIGGRPGINHFIEVNNVIGKSCRDAGLDSHPGSRFVAFRGGAIECAATATIPKDGIMFQGQDVEISGIKVIGAYIKSVAVNSYAAAGRSHSVKIHDITVEDAGVTASTTRGVHVSTLTAGEIGCVEISGVTVNGGAHQGIHIEAVAAAIRNVTVAKNPLVKAIENAILFDARSGFPIDGFSIQGNTLDSTQTPIYCYGDTGGTIANGSITANRLKTTGAYGVRYRNTSNVLERSNVVTGATSNNHFIDVGSSNIDLERRQSTIRTVGTSAATVADQDKYIIVNRSSTSTTLTLPNAADHVGREISISRNYAFTVDSASANVVPLGSTVAGTAILPAVSGTWVLLKSDGTNWVILQGRLT